MKTAVYTILSIMVISTSTFAGQCGGGDESTESVKIEKNDQKPIDPKDLVNQDS